MFTYLLIAVASELRSMCESRGGHPGLPVPNKPSFCGRKSTFKQNHHCHHRAQELCEPVEVAVLGSPPLIVHIMSVGIKQHWNSTWTHCHHWVLELCQSRGGRTGLPVPDSPHGLYGRKEKLNLNSLFWSCVKVEVAVIVSVDEKQHWTRTWTHCHLGKQTRSQAQHRTESITMLQLCPLKPHELLGTGSPGRPPPPLPHSSWALTEQTVNSSTMMIYVHRDRRK